MAKLIPKRIERFACAQYVRPLPRRSHAALTSMAIAVRHGAEVSVWSWKCLRYPNLGLARPTYMKNAAAAGAHVADIGGKQRVLLKHERVFSLGTQRDDYLESHEAAHYVPSSVIDEIASSPSGKASHRPNTRSLK